MLLLIYEPLKPSSLVNLSDRGYSSYRSTTVVETVVGCIRLSPTTWCDSSAYVDSLYLLR